MKYQKSDFIEQVEKFEYLVHATLVVAVAVVTLCAIALLGLDIYSFVLQGLSQGIGTILASLLILWVLLELLNTQIEFLKGGRPSISVFVVVALVAFVRKLMVASLDAQKIESAYFYLGSIFVLGLVYVMIGLTDRKRDQTPTME
jgi:uncharacterized membrane protein (DUF373 family)